MFSEDSSSSVVECQSHPLDSTHLITIVSSSISSSSSNSSFNSKSSINQFTNERISRLLKNEPSNYKVIKNTNDGLTSVGWKVFGFPAKK